MLKKSTPRIKQCPECRRMVDAATMRALARTRLGGRVRVSCPDCYRRVMKLRKAVAARR